MTLRQVHRSSFYMYKVVNNEAGFNYINVTFVKPKSLTPDVLQSHFYNNPSKRDEFFVKVVSEYINT